jgi:hypothetical protein
MLSVAVLAQLHQQFQQARQTCALALFDRILLDQLDHLAIGSQVLRRRQKTADVAFEAQGFGAKSFR